MKISTINVVEMLDGDIIGLTAFPNSDDGNRDAKILCYDLIAEDDPDLLEKEIEKIMGTEDQYKAKNTDYVIKMVMSTE